MPDGRGDVDVAFGRNGDFRGKKNPQQLQRGGVIVEHESGFKAAQNKFGAYGPDFGKQI